MKRITFLAVLLLVSTHVLPQESKPTKVSVSELPPEAFPPATCKESYSGYLEVRERGKTKDKNLTPQQVGEYVKKRLSDGYSLSLFPQASGRFFVIETCLAKN